MNKLLLFIIVFLASCTKENKLSKEIYIKLESNDVYSKEINIYQFDELYKYQDRTSYNGFNIEENYKPTMDYTHFKVINNGSYHLIVKGRNIDLDTVLINYPYIFEINFKN